jgi:hypothetical protein
MIVLAFLWLAQQTWKVTAGGTPIGEENDTFDGATMMSHTVIRVSPKLQIEMDTKTVTDEAGHLVSCSGKAKAGDTQEEFSIELKDGTLTCRAVVNGKEENSAPMKIVDPLWPLANNVFAHIANALKAKGGRFKFYAIATRSVLDAMLEDKGEVELKRKDEALKVRHYLLSVAHLGLSLYVHRDRVILIDNPLQRVVGVDSEYEGYAVSTAQIEVKRPENVDEADVTFPSGSLKLAGSFTRPTGAAKVPAVVLITGSGPQDRDENITGDPIFKEVAYRLSAAGVAVLRVDDRGVGKSEGDFGRAKLSDLVADVKAAVAYLRTREDIGAVGLVGHSEGGVIAPIVAAQDETIRAIFLMAGTARRLDEIMLQQTEAAMKESGVSEDQIRTQLESARAIQKKIRESSEDEMEIDGHKQFVGWLREHFRHDPFEQIKKVKAFVCVLQGMRDRQVFPENAELLEQAMKDAGKTNYEVRRFEKLDHLFMPSTGKLSDYSDRSRRVDPAFLDALAETAAAHLRD